MSMMAESKPPSKVIILAVLALIAFASLFFFVTNRKDSQHELQRSTPIQPMNLKSVLLIVLAICTAVALIVAVRIKVDQRRRQVMSVLLAAQLKQVGPDEVGRLLGVPRQNTEGGSRYHVSVSVGDTWTVLVHHTDNGKITSIEVDGHVVTDCILDPASCDLLAY
jgi:hypothetical protein